MSKSDSKGIIYIMSTVIKGLIKIGRTATDQFETRMNFLENNGYRNVTGLKREFAIEVEDYVDKEILLHTIFEKSQVADGELFSLDINIAKQLLSSFDGKVIYPVGEKKEEIFDEAVETSKSKGIPDGVYYFKRKKKSDARTVDATAVVKDGRWIIKKGSVLGVHKDSGISKNTEDIRASINISNDGKLLEDCDLGECTPSLAARVVLYSSSNGWVDWTTKDGQPIDIFRKKDQAE